MSHGHWVDIKLSIIHLLRLAVFHFQFGCVSERERVIRYPGPAAAADNGQSLCGCGTAEQDAEGRCPGGRASNELSRRFRNSQ